MINQLPLYLQTANSVSTLHVYSSQDVELLKMLFIITNGRLEMDEKNHKSDSVNLQFNFWIEI